MERKRPFRVYMQFEMTDEDVFHTFTRDEWFSEVWSNSYDNGDDAYFTSEKDGGVAYALALCRSF